MKVTIHAASREDVPALARTLMLWAADRGGVQVMSVGRPGVTVDAETALAYLSNGRPTAAAIEAAEVADDPPPPPKVTRAPSRQAETDTGTRQPRRPGRPRKTTTASSEG